MSIHELLVNGFGIVRILGGTYLLIILVALLHPDKQRRADALRVLQLHRLSRK